MMKKMKNKVVFAFAIIISFMIVNVYAYENKTYINGYGVELTQKEYEFVNDYYGFDYFENMTQEDYNWISVLDINNNDIDINVIYDNDEVNVENLLLLGNVSINGTSHTTSSKKLVIAKSCSSVKCTILTNLTWLKNPSVRSYDVIGARFDGTSLYTNTISTKVSSSSGTSYYSYNQFLSNGFGTSVKLPSGSTNIIVEQSFSVNLGGSIYASYQHATSNISLSTSKKYVIDQYGLGSVFNFYGSALGVYDGMAGVNI